MALAGLARLEVGHNNMSVYRAIIIYYHDHKWTDLRSPLTGFSDENRRVLWGARGLCGKQPERRGARVPGVPREPGRGSA